MTANYKTLSNFEVATAEEAQSLFMDQAIVKVDTSADLATLPNEVKTAYVLNTGILMARNSVNAWVPQGGAATVSETAPSNPQTGQLWVKPSEVLPAATRGSLVAATSGAITATAWGTVVPTATPLDVVVAKAAIYRVTCGAWVQAVAGAATDTRVRLAWTGAATGDSFNHTGGWGSGVMYQGPSPASNTYAPYNKQTLAFNIALPVGTTTFKVEAYKNGSGTGGSVNYVIFEAMPVQWADAYVAGVS